MSSSQEVHILSDRRVVANPGGLSINNVVDSLDLAHHVKAKTLNDALQEIDMGRFQVRFVCAMSLT